jgi:hypothetical protein
VQWFASGPRTESGFCRLCGSKLFWRDLDADDLDVTLGSLLAPTGLKIAKHIWVGSKGDYYDIADDLPQFRESTRGAKPVARAPSIGPAGPQPSLHRGRCLCGKIRLRIEGPMRDIIVCHCGQCRKWHGHTPGYSSAEWSQITLEGQEHLRWYDSSDAARRGFCGTCGSALFWERRNAKSVSITSGCLEPPTGLRATMHIYVKDKGDYYDILDGLPRLDGSSLNTAPVF